MEVYLKRVEPVRVRVLVESNGVFEEKSGSEEIGKKFEELASNERRSTHHHRALHSPLQKSRVLL